MATKNKDGASMAGATAQNTSEAPEPIRSVEAAVQPKEFTWRGHARFGCPECGYDSGDKDQVLDHIRAKHSGKSQLAANYVYRGPGSRKG